MYDNTIYKIFYSNYVTADACMILCIWRETNQSTQSRERNLKNTYDYILGALPLPSSGQIITKLTVSNLMCSYKSAKNVVIIVVISTCNWIGQFVSFLYEMEHSSQFSQTYMYVLCLNKDCWHWSEKGKYEEFTHIMKKKKEHCQTNLESNSFPF